MTSPKSKSRLAEALLVVFGIAFAFVLAEAGYRVILRVQHAERFVTPEISALGVYDKSYWEYDEDFGYRYPPKRVIHLTNVADGLVNGCGTLDVINERGNIGPIVGDYDTAEQKVLLFGDSWAAFQVEGLTVADFLQETLERETGKSTHVVNFGRDGYSILQMFDMAAAKIPEWKPDVAIIAFITDDLLRARFWRTVTSYGGTPRVMQVYEPDPNPPLEAAHDVFVIHPEATQEWCQAISGTGKRDRILDEMLGNYRDVLLSSGVELANIWRPDHSYLWSRATTGNAFGSLGASTRTPTLEIDSYAEDAQFMRRVAELKALGVPIMLFHFAIPHEVTTGQEFIVSYRQDRLLESIEAATGFRIHGTLDHYDGGLKDPLKMMNTPSDAHPSHFAMDLYAESLTQSLLRNGYLD